MFRIITMDGLLRDPRIEVKKGSWNPTRICMYYKNRGGPSKWMVYNGKPIKIDDLGVPLCLETPICMYYKN